MLTWYQSKVKYDALNGDKTKTVSELYLHEAVNFGEVEKQCYEHLKTRIKDPDVDAIAKAPFDEVVFFAGTRLDEFDADPFYRVGIDSGEKALYLVPAKDAEQAIERALSAHGYGDAHNVVEVKRTEILAIWHPNSELWQGDWHNRMERLLERKRHSWDLNQTELDFNGKDNDQDDDNDDQPNYGYAQRRNQLHDELTKFGNSLGAVEVTASGTDKSGKKKSVSVNLRKRKRDG
jgi:hypothetical protein